MGGGQFAHGLKMIFSPPDVTRHKKMAAAAEESAADVIALDIFDGSVLVNDGTSMRNLTEEEKNEVAQIMQVIRSTQSNTDDEPKAARHKPVNADELDRLALKNSAESTSYQTKWALTVFQGTNNYISLQIIKYFHETFKFAAGAAARNGS